jgi:hypothetical protein
MSTGNTDQNRTPVPAEGRAPTVTAGARSPFKVAGLPEDDLRPASLPQCPPAAPRPGDRVTVTDGLHAGREGRVRFVLPASGQYARVELPEGLRTIPTRHLRRLHSAAEERTVE